jgi:hypothetical protein
MKQRLGWVVGNCARANPSWIPPHLVEVSRWTLLQSTIKVLACFKWSIFASSSGSEIEAPIIVVKNDANN